MRIKRNDEFLTVLIILLSLIFLGNVVEYFAVNKQSLKKINGKISEVILKTYKCPTHSTRRSGGFALCEKTIIKLEGISGSFRVSDYSDRGAYIEGIHKGDQVSVYIRKWYQYILTFGAGKDIYGLEKDGVVYYDIDRWKRYNIAVMIISGAFLLFFLPLYIIQRVTINKLERGKRV